LLRKKVAVHKNTALEVAPLLHLSQLEETKRGNDFANDEFRREEPRQIACTVWNRVRGGKKSVRDDMDGTARAESLLMRLLRTRGVTFSSVFLRYALALGFLSAVADRFGLWGSFGQPNVAWGSFSRFLEYTHRLNWYLPAGIVLPLGVITTGAELLFGLLLLVGWHTRVTALLSGLLLMLFGLAMALALGVEAPLNASVFPAAGAALLLAQSKRFPFSVDDLVFRRCRTGTGDRPLYPLTPAPKSVGSILGR
jgi:uncharacterized membrane protein YphA (DoxX/SURF4 family)